MGVLQDNYKSFLKDMEDNIKNKEDLDYIKKRFGQFLNVVLAQMDYIMEYKSEEIDNLEKKQKELYEKMEKMEIVVNNIEKDIYSEDGFDFEIVCPYCNYEFVIDVDENKTEVECPECSNIIELDWSGDLEEDSHKCSGACSACSECEEEDNTENDIEENKDEGIDDDIDDDM